MKTSASLFVLAAVFSAWTVSAANADPVSPLSSQHATVQMPMAAFSCAQAASQLTSAGYTSVTPTDCDGLQYVFEVGRGDARFVIVFNAESGGSVVIPE
jgi:hypothetical protein